MSVQEMCCRLALVVGGSGGRQAGRLARPARLDTYPSAANVLLGWGQAVRGGLRCTGCGAYGYSNDDNPDEVSTSLASQ